MGSGRTIGNNCCCCWDDVYSRIICQLVSKSLDRIAFCSVLANDRS